MADQSIFRPAAGQRAYDPRTLNTILSPDEEDQFYRSWRPQYVPVDKNGVPDSGVDYDYQGAFAAGLKPNADQHWPDTFKKPNHPTFSNQSQYAPLAPERAGSWNGEQYVPPTPQATVGTALQRGYGLGMANLDNLAASIISVKGMAPNAVADRYREKQRQFEAYANTFPAAQTMGLKAVEAVPDMAIQALPAYAFRLPQGATRGTGGKPMGSRVAPYLLGTAMDALGLTAMEAKAARAVQDWLGWGKQPAPPPGPETNYSNLERLSGATMTPAR